AGARPGPDPRDHLFANVTTDPTAVARLAARYAIADSGGTAQAAIFTAPELAGAPTHAVISTDSESAIAARKAQVMEAELRSCRRCSVLAVIDTPIAAAEQRMARIGTSLVERFVAPFW